MFAPTERWLSTFVDSTREVMRRVLCRVNSCVEAGCIGVGVAREFGYIAVPVPVAALVQAGNEATILPGPADSWDRRGGGGGFRGHLLLHFAGDTLVDLTADQFHAPARGIYLPDPIVVPCCPRELLAGGVAFEVGGTTVTYREMVGNLEWQALPAWTGSSAVPIRLVVAEMRRRLDTPRGKIRRSAARRR